jgi:hypothetical protein
MPSRTAVRESVDVGALDDLIDTLGEQQESKAIPERAPIPPARDKWIGGKGTRTLFRERIWRSSFALFSYFAGIMRSDLVIGTHSSSQ